MKRWAMSLPCALAALLSLLLLPGSAAAENHKQHLGFAVGYQRLLSSDLKTDQVDYRNSGLASIQYRLSLRPNLDFTVDARGTAHTENVSGTDLTLTGSFFGPGVRLVSPNEGMRPFVQANFFLVDEEIDAEVNDVMVSTSKTGAGFGVSAGVDIRASNLLSVPIEANFMYGKPSDDISGLGISAGLTFNFGSM